MVQKLRNLQVHDMALEKCNPKTVIEKVKIALFQKENSTLMANDVMDQQKE